MNHKEKQQEILIGCGALNCIDPLYGSQELCPVCNLEAKAHKEEVMKGCKKFDFEKENIKVYCGDLHTGGTGIWLCPTCQAIIDKYSENGI